MHILIKLFNFYKLVILLLVLDSCFADNVNSTKYERESHVRSKRWITYQPGGGLAKLTLGALSTISFNHYKLVRNIVAIANVQANYNIPSSIIWPVPENYFKHRLNNDFEDNSRGVIYQTLERMFDTFGTDGRDCVLKAICEIAEAPLGHNGMFGEILDVVFTPFQMDHDYKEARMSGLNGKDCEKLYYRCPAGSGILEKMSFLHLMK